jgi:hypothetical protein
VVNDSVPIGKAGLAGGRVAIRNGEGAQETSAVVLT